MRLVADRGLELRATRPQQVVHIHGPLEDALLQNSPRVADLRYAPRTNSPLSLVSHP
jgi:hypothetical protein